MGKFEISNLPKKKAGEAKIEIKLGIKEKSILIVTATDVSDPKNNKILPIKKQINFEKIMNDLILRENSFKFVENDLYNEIKFSIIELEEEIKKLTKKKKIDNELIKSKQKAFLKKVENSSKIILFQNFLIYIFHISNIILRKFANFTNNIIILKSIISIIMIIILLILIMIILIFIMSLMMIMT